MAKASYAVLRTSCSNIVAFVTVTGLVDSKHPDFSSAERGVTVTTIPATLPFNDVPSNTHQACFGSAHNPHGFKHNQASHSTVPDPLF
jgi:hypothetical protein